MNSLECTYCGVRFELDRKFLVATKLPAGGVKIEVGCAHVAPDISSAIAVLGGGDCATKWFQEFLWNLRCDHRNEAGGANG